jgi:hypothetical protein
MNVKVSGDTPSLLAWLITAAIVLVVVGGIIVAQLVWRRRRPTVAEAPAVPTLIDEPPAARHVRSPSDYLHLFVGVIVVAIGLLLAIRASNTIVGLEADLLRFFNAMPDLVARTLNVTMEVILGLVPIAVGVVVLLNRTYRLLGMLIAASFLAQFLLLVLDAEVV